MQNICAHAANRILLLWCEILFQLDKTETEFRRNQHYWLRKSRWQKVWFNSYMYYWCRFENKLARILNIDLINRHRNWFNSLHSKLSQIKYYNFPFYSLKKWLQWMNFLNTLHDEALFMKFWIYTDLFVCALIFCLFAWCRWLKRNFWIIILELVPL